MSRHELVMSCHGRIQQIAESSGLVIVQIVSANFCEENASIPLFYFD